MKKSDLINALCRMNQLTVQSRLNDPNVAQEYYEKVQHLASIMHSVKKFERQLLNDLDVD
jgi:hypothetical protein